MQIFSLRFGSICKVGRQSATTRAYIPHGPQLHVASPEVDWWALAFTLAGMGSDGHGMEDDTRSQSVSVDVIRQTFGSATGSGCACGAIRTAEADNDPLI